MKSQKGSNVLVIFMAVFTTIALWFMEDVVERSLGYDMPSPGNQVMRIICHIWAVQMAVSLLFGAVFPLKFPGLPFARSFGLALLGGTIGTLFLRGFPHLWVWWMPLALAVFGLCQLTLVALIIGTSLRQGYS
jgi:hypothetical protein